MKRTPLKRKTALRRSPMRRSRKPTKYRARPRDVEYMVWVRRQTCCASYLGVCRGPVEADHAGRRGVGRKADDTTCIPLCRYHHRCRGSFSGVFRVWDKARMRNWLDAMIKWYQIRWRQEHGGK